MKKLLVVSYLFSPASVIGAIRWTKMSKYLSRLGYSIDVITTSAMVPEDNLLIRDMQQSSNINIIRINHRKHQFDQTVYYRDAQTAAQTKEAAETGKKSVMRRLKDAVWRCRVLNGLTSRYVASQDYGRSKDFAVEARKYIRKSLNMNQYAAIICTYGPTGGTLLAKWLKQNYPDIPLIMDFRDPMFSPFVPQPYRSTYSHLQRDICNAADRIIAVTDDLEDRICTGSGLREKCSVIPNGYDPEDFAEIEPKCSDKYSIVYTGAIYKEHADFSPLFDALRELSAADAVQLENIVIDYIGYSGAVLEKQAAAHGFSDMIINHGPLPRRQTLAWQRGARQLLLTIWNQKNDGGYRPGKLLEYMASGRPVIGLVSGDTGNSVLRRTIEQGRFGIAHEGASAQADSAALRQYIADDYSRWKQGLEPELSPDSSYISSFGYPALAARVAALIEETQ